MNQFGRVAAYLSSPYGYLYSAQCRVMVGVECRVRSETVIGVCTVHSVE